MHFVFMYLIFKLDRVLVLEGMKSGVRGNKTMQITHTHKRQFFFFNIKNKIKKKEKEEKKEKKKLEKEEFIQQNSYGEKKCNLPMTF